MASSAEIKVVLLASEWSSKQSGLSRLNRELAIQLAKHPKVKLFVFLPKCDKNETERDAAITIVQAEPIPSFVDEVDWLRFPPKWLKIDFVIACGEKLGRQAQIIRGSHFCKWIQIVNTFPEELGTFIRNPDSMSLGELRHRQEVEFFATADLVLAMGFKLADEYRSYLRLFGNAEHVFELSPGIFNDFPDISQMSHDQRIIRILAFGYGDAGDFNLRGFNIAAKAVAKLDDAHLIFVGGASMEQEEVSVRLKECDLPESRLRVRSFTGNQERLKELFCEVDLLVVPWRTRVLGLTALEALSAGLPILVSGYSDFGKALQQVPSGSAFVINSADPEQWAEGISQMMEKPRAVRLEESKALLQNYAEKYNWRKQTSDFVEQMMAIRKCRQFNCYFLIYGYIYLMVAVK